MNTQKKAETTANDNVDNVKKRFNLSGEEPVFIGKWVGVAGGILGGVNAYMTQGASPVAALLGTAAGGAVGYAIGNVLEDMERFGVSGKILNSAAAGLNGAAVSMAVTELFNSFSKQPE